MYKLPTAFIERMKKQLPESEWEAFFSVYEGQPYRGVRVNTLKITPEEFSKIFPVGAPVEWEENGFYYDGDKVGAKASCKCGLSRAKIAVHCHKIVCFELFCKVIGNFFGIGG